MAQLELTASDAGGSGKTFGERSINRTAVNAPPKSSRPNRRRFTSEAISFEPRHCYKVASSIRARGLV